MLLKNMRWQKCSDLSDNKLRELAIQFGVEPNKTDVIKGIGTDPKTGKTKRDRRVIVPKSRYLLEEEVERAMRLEFHVPDELWTEKQITLWREKRMSDVRNGGQQNRMKVELGLLIYLDGEEVEVSDEVGELILKRFNIKREKIAASKMSEGGRIIKSAEYEEVPRLWVKRTDAEEEFICRYCDFVAKSSGGLGRHESTCSENPSNKINLGQSDDDTTAGAENLD